MRIVWAVVVVVLLTMPQMLGAHQRPTVYRKKSSGYSDGAVGLAIFAGILDAMIRSGSQGSSHNRNYPKRRGYPGKSSSRYKPRAAKGYHAGHKPVLPITDPDRFNGALLPGNNPFDDIDPDLEWTGSSNNTEFRKMRQESTSKPIADDEVHAPDYRDIDWNSPYALIRARELDAERESFKADVIRGIENTLTALNYAGKAAQLGLGFCTGAGVPTLMTQATAIGIGGFAEHLSKSAAKGKVTPETVVRSLIKGGVDAAANYGLGKFGSKISNGFTRGVYNLFSFGAGESISSKASARLLSERSRKKSASPSNIIYWRGNEMSK